MKQLLLYLSAIAVLASCNRAEKVAYSDFVAFGEDGWDPLCVVGFTPYPADSLAPPGERFDLILTLRYSPRDLSQSIPLEITEEDENGITDTERITIKLCDDKGEPLGKKGIALYEISDTLRRNISLPDGYALSVSSLSPPENTLCLRNLGITLTRR